jgi:hypothetical protein
MEVSLLVNSSVTAADIAVLDNVEAVVARGVLVKIVPLRVFGLANIPPLVVCGVLGVVGFGLDAALGLEVLVATVLWALRVGRSISLIT